MIKTPHIEADEGDFAKTVLMPGDPLRAKYIAEKYLVDYKLINNIRNMFGYTGYYKGKKITVMSSGMGIPSMGIYSYELYKFFKVENIIRIGSAGTSNADMNLLDVILSDKVYSETNFAYSYDDQNCHLIESSKNVNEIILKKAKELNIKINYGDTLCSECFDAYAPESKIMMRLPIKPLGVEMEAFALFYIAKKLNKNASCLLTVSDSIVKKEEISAMDRQKSFDDMIVLALESGILL